MCFVARCLDQRWTRSLCPTARRRENLRHLRSGIFSVQNVKMKMFWITVLRLARDTVWTSVDSLRILNCFDMVLLSVLNCNHVFSWRCMIRVGPPARAQKAQSRALRRGPILQGGRTTLSTPISCVAFTTRTVYKKIMVSADGLQICEEESFLALFTVVCRLVRRDCGLSSF